MKALCSAFRRWLRWQPPGQRQSAAAVRRDYALGAATRGEFDAVVGESAPPRTRTPSAAEEAV